MNILLIIVRQAQILYVIYIYSGWNIKYNSLTYDREELDYAPVNPILIDENHFIVSDGKQGIYDFDDNRILEFSTLTGRGTIYKQEKDKYLVYMTGLGILNELYELTGLVSSVSDPVFEPEIYPNPSDGMFYIDLVDPFLDVQIVDVAGISVEVPIIPSENQLILDLSNEPAGTYFLTIVGNDYSLNYKLVKGV